MFTMNSLPTPQKRRPTPDRIMLAARNLFVRDGYHSVSVDAIVAASEVSKGTFFYHFKSKETLAERLMADFIQRQGEGIRQTLVRAREEESDPAEVLDRVLVEMERVFDGSYIEGSPDQPGCLMGSFSYQTLAELPAVARICRDALRGWVKRLGPVFDDLAAVRQHPEMTGDQLSKLLYASLQGTLIARRIDPDWTSLGEQLVTFRSLLRSLDSGQH